MRWSVSHGAPCGRRQWQVLTRRERAAAGRGAYRDPRLCRAGWQVPEEWRQLSCHSTINSRNSVVICGGERIRRRERHLPDPRYYFNVHTRSCAA